MNSYQSYKQRLYGLWLILMFMAGMMILSFYNEYAENHYRPSVQQDCKIRTTIRINIDPWTSLVRLPQIGETKAKDIANYRNNAKQIQPQRIVFGKIEDMDRIRGFGRATLEDIEPYISFDPEASNPESP